MIARRLLPMLLALSPALTAYAAPPVESVRLYAFDCGRIQFDDFSYFSDTGDYDGQSGTLAASCFLIRHPKGDLLWDTGLGDRLAGKPDGERVRSLTMVVDKPLLGQLQEIGMTPADVEYLSLSHFHYDHTGNANAFTQSTWLLSRREVEALEGTPPPPSVNIDNLSGRKQAKVELLDLDRDVFGDGSVKILRANGHTAGHQVLMVKLPKSGTVILSGDLYHTRENHEQGRMPGFNHSRGETLGSFDRINRLLKNTKGRLIIQHEPRDLATLPKIPAYLD